MNLFSSHASSIQSPLLNNSINLLTFTFSDIISMIDHRKSNFKAVAMNSYGTGRNATPANSAVFTRPITKRRLKQWTNSIQTTAANPQPPVTPEMQKYGRRRIRLQKYLFQISIVTAKSVYLSLLST